MNELKPSRELLRIYGIQEESGEARGLMIASNAPNDVTLATLKLCVLMLEKGQGQHIKDVRIKDPAEMKFHVEE